MRVRLLMIFVLILSRAPSVSANEIELFAGSASKPATEEVVKQFEAETGHVVTVHFGSSGELLSQMKIARQGDLYFPGSPDFMKIAVDDGIVVPQTEKIVAYLIPALNVHKGNPKQIHSLQDLARKDVRVAIGNPRHVCVGLYAVEILEHAGLSRAVKPRISGYTESCAKTANIVAMNGVDVVLGWRVFQYWNPEQIEAIPLAPGQVVRISYMPIALSSFARNPAVAGQLADYFCSAEAKSVFEKWGYITREKTARALAPRATIGGEFILPGGW